MSRPGRVRVFVIEERGQILELESSDARLRREAKALG
jgi:hypothetical protein